MITFAQISDLHVDLGERATGRLRRLVAVLRPMRDLDAVLVTGDVTDHGAAAEYDLLLELLAPIEVPVLVLPGNHDVRAQFAAALLGRPEARSGLTVGPDGELNRSVPVGPVDVLLCDSVVPGSSAGRLSDATLDWLRAELADRDRDRPALLAFHHPPVVLHLPGMDRIRQTGVQRLAAVLADHPEVVALFSGHVHLGAVTSFAGRPLVCGPGCVSTLRPPVEAAGVIDLDAPPGYALHLLDDEARLVTFFRSI